MTRTKIQNSSLSFDGGTLSGFRNAIINGNFDIWQRGTSFSNPAAGAFTADRWVPGYNGSGATRTLSRQSFTLGQTDVPGEPTFFFRYNQSVAGTSGTISNLQQRIEGVRTFANQQITVSFYAQAASAITLPAIKFTQYFGTGGSPSADANTTAASSISIGTSWSRYSYTVTLPSISGKTIGSDANDYLNLVIELPLNSTFTFDIAQVQVESGPVATPFERRPFGTELALCQRYYQDFAHVGPWRKYVVNVHREFIPFPVTMRAAPILTRTATTTTNLGTDSTTAGTQYGLYIDFQYTAGGTGVVDLGDYRVRASAEL